MPTDRIDVLAALAELDQYFMEVAMQVAREARREFEGELLGDLLSGGHIEFATELQELFNADD